MKNYKYLLFIFIFILIVIAFKFPFLLKTSEIGKKLNEITEVNHSKEIQEVLTKFDSLYNNNIKQSGAVGGAVVITYKGQVALIKCFGVKKLGENNPVDINTVFRLASVSKTITGVLAGILDEENTVKLDDNVLDYMPEFKIKYPENTRDVKVRHLLSHTSGLTPHAFDMMVEDKVPLEKIIPRLNEVEIVAPPGCIMLTRM
jgi:beta-lactamase class C